MELTQFVKEFCRIKEKYKSEYVIVNCIDNFNIKASDFEIIQDDIVHFVLYGNENIFTSMSVHNIKNLYYVYDLNEENV
jgi:hypothetical protein